MISIAARMEMMRIMFKLQAFSKTTVRRSGADGNASRV
jgi:hypothetical protein